MLSLALRFKVAKFDLVWLAPELMLREPVGAVVSVVVPPPPPPPLPVPPVTPVTGV